jgi:hypothetical protein
MPTITVRPRLYGYPGFGYWHLGQDEIPVDTTDYGVPTEIPTEGDIPISPVTDSSAVPSQLSPITQTVTSSSGNLTTTYGVASDGSLIPLAATAGPSGMTAPNTTITSQITPSVSPTVSSTPTAMSQILANPMVWMEQETIIPGMQNWMVMGIAGVGTMMLVMMTKGKKR